MSNRSIAERILEVVAAFERGSIGASAIAESIEIHEPALESVSRVLRDELHRLSVQVIGEDVSPQEESLLGIKSSKVALVKLKSLLQAIE